MLGATLERIIDLDESVPHIGHSSLTSGKGKRDSSDSNRTLFFTELGIPGRDGWVRFSSQCAMCVSDTVSECWSTAAGKEVLGPGRSFGRIRLPHSRSA